MHRVHAHACERVLKRGSLGESGNRVLAGHVRGRALEGHEAQNARDVDYRAAARGDDGRDAEAHAVQDAVQVNPDDLVPVLDIDLARGRALAADSGVVHQDMEPAECFDGLSDGGLDVRDLCDVALHEDRRAAGLLDHRDGLIAAGLVHVAHNHLRTAAREAHSSLATDVRAAARYERDLTLEVSHVSSLLYACMPMCVSRTKNGL